MAIKLHLLVQSCTICSSGSRRPVRKLLDTRSYRPISCSRNIRRFLSIRMMVSARVLCYIRS